MLLKALLLLATLLIPLLTLRTLYRQRLSRPRPRPAPPSRKLGTPTRVLVVLGSGGHTGEMLAMLRGLDTRKYTHRTYVVSAGDAFSAGKARAFEAGLARAAGTFDVATVPRARRVHQPLLTAPWSSARCLLACFAVLRAPAPAPPASGPSHPDDEARTNTLRDRRDEQHAHAQGYSYSYPDLILTNGPGTGVMVVLAALALRAAFAARDALAGPPRRHPRGGMRAVYVESWARVRRLSLSGRILLPLVDRFVVQWETLLPATKGRGEFLGALV